MREKLIELLVNSPGLDTLYGKEEEFAENADWLIANGVTIKKKPTKVKPRKRKQHEITTETFLALEKIGQQTHKGE